MDVFHFKPKVPPLLKDFSVWLHPKNLRIFPFRESLRLTSALVKTRVKALPPHVQDYLGADLDGTDLGLGHFALRIYFYQLFASSQFSLDLRPRRFHYADAWRFQGEILACHYSSQFIGALRQTYVAYYEQNDEVLKTSLMDLGLLQMGWQDNVCSQMLALVKSHFSYNGSTKQRFSLSEMIHSFTQIFQFVRDHGGKINAEFVLLGVYLTSLYMTLEQLDCDLDVQECFFFAKDAIDQL